MFQKNLPKPVGLVNACSMQKPLVQFDSLFGLAKGLLCEIVVIEIQIHPSLVFSQITQRKSMVPAMNADPQMEVCLVTNANHVTPSYELLGNR